MSGADRGHGPTDCDTPYLMAVREIAALKAERSALANRVDELEYVLQTVNNELCGLISPPFDGPTFDKWPDKLNEADRQCLSYALKAVREDRALLAKSNPVCGTCGGKGWIPTDDPAPNHFTDPCPDCAKEIS